MIITDQASFSAELEKLEEMMTWVQKMANLAQLNVAESRKVEIALEEALVNVIHYAYIEKCGSIELSCRLDPRAFIEFTLRDTGLPFNPLLQGIKRRPKHEKLEDKEEGGLGILFMRTLMDDVHYERQQDRNVLTLKKYLQGI